MGALCIFYYSVKAEDERTHSQAHARRGLPARRHGGRGVREQARYGVRRGRGRAEPDSTMALDINSSPKMILM